MQLNDSHDETFYRNLCRDLAFELGLDIFKEGGEALVCTDADGAVKATLARPTSPEFFWEETWFALRRAFGPRAPIRMCRPKGPHSTPSESSRSRAG